MNLPLRLENLKRHFATLSMLLSVALSLATGRAQIASVNSYNLPANNTAMSNVVSTGGSIWFLSNINTGDGGYQYYLNSTTPSGVTTQYSLNTTNIPYPVGNSIAVGPDGALWFPAGEDGDGAIVRVTTAGAISTYPLTNPYVFVNGPGSITAGPNNDLWFTDPGSVSGAQVGRVTTSGTFSFFPVTNPAFGITLGPDGNLWATEYTREAQESSGSYYWTGQVAKITPAGVETRYNMPQVRVLLSGFNETPIDTFATGSDGALWFTEYDGAQVGRVTTSGSVTTVYTGAADGITSGPDGELWLTQPSVSGNGAQTGGPALIQLQTSGTTNSYPLNSDVFDNPGGIAVGPDLALWFNDSSAAVVGQAILKLAITTTQSSVPNGTAGVAYPTTTFRAEYGTTPYSWSAPTTSLPPGLTLSSAGVLAGTPTSAGTFSFTVTVTDSGSPAQTATAMFSITITAGTPASVVATSGSGQSARVNTAFGQQLVATVIDSNGNPVPGVNVTFTAPTSGASGLFGANATVTATTNGAGVAMSGAFTANGIAGPYTVSASVPGATSAAFSLTNTPGPAASITASGGSGQTAQIDTAFGTPLLATVKDAGGNAIAGVMVTFTAPAGGASGTFAGAGATASATTNAAGVATSPVFTANGTAGSYSVSASAAGLEATANFALMNTAGSAGNIVATSGTPQSAPIGSAFASPLMAKVTDSGGNPVANATVTFAAPASGASGTFAGSGATATAITNSSGIAMSPTFNANLTAGTYNVSGSVAGVAAQATFVLTNTAGAAASIAVVSGSGQSAAVGTMFGTSLVAIVKDTGGNPVSGVGVTFSSPTTGPGGTFSGSATATVSTNSAGMATAPAFSANGAAGSYFVTASTAGVAAPASFALTNTAGPPASIAVMSGSGQSAQIHNTFASAFTVIVKDASGNASANATVTFAAPGSGASGAFAGGGTAVNVTTGTNGIAISPAFTANGTAGSYVVSAGVSGVPTSASFALTNTAGAPASITVTSGANQSVTVGSAFAPLVATVRDSGGNPVANANVTFTAAPSGASGTFSGGSNGGLTATVQTNTAGVATAPTFTANSTAGSYNVSAAVTGVSTQAIFQLANNAGAPSIITVSSGNGQFAQVNTPYAMPLVVLVTDASNNPVANVRVTFTAPNSGASCTFGGGGSAVSVSTNSSGLASTQPVPAKANATAGAFNVVISASGVASTATLTLNNSAGAPGSIAITSGSPQSVAVRAAFAPLVVLVEDASGNAVANATVTFTAPGSGASGTFAGAGTTATATTNSSGSATAPIFTANATAGSYSVTASVSGAGSPVAFILTNNPGSAASIVASTGTPQTARVNTAFNNFLVVKVSDASGNPIGGANVIFSAPGSGASGTFPGGALTATVQTNSSGVGTSPIFSANGTVGSYNVAASVAGVSTTANFMLTNVAGLTITTPTNLPGGTTGIQYEQILSVAAGTPPYNWSVSHGTLPTGLTLNASSGAITGVPTAVGTYTFTVMVTDSSNPAQTASVAFTLKVTAPALTITTPSALPPGTAYTPYTQTLAGSGGTLPYKWIVASGALPPGLTLNAATGLISGTPTTPGTFSFTINLNDGSTPQLSTSQPFTLNISGTGTQPIVPVFTIHGIPGTQSAGTTITGPTLQLSSPSSALFAGTLSLSFTPNPTYSSGLPEGYLGDIAFVSSNGAKSTQEAISVPAETTSVQLPDIDPGTVAGDVTVNLAIPGQTGATATVTVPASAPTIEANSVQITNVTSTGFNVELVATSTTRELTNATFTFTPAAGATLNGTSFTVDVSSLLSQWFSGSTSLPYGGAFTMTIPFSLSGSASAIQSVSVTVSNSIGTSTAVSGTQ